MNHLRTLLMIVLAALLLAACGATPTADTPSTPPASTPASPAAADDEPLMIVKFTGGMCRMGSCDSTLTVLPDGSYTMQLGQEASADGALDAATVDALRQGIATTDFAAIKADPFTGTCPIAFDGQELIYTFNTADGEQTLASCTVNIPADAPLFQTVGSIVETAQQEAAS